MSMSMNAFIGGGMLVAAWTIALFFFQFGRRTGDQLFTYFSYAFLLFGVERIVIVFGPTSDEVRPYIYLIRLIAFLLIIFGIIHKNVTHSPDN